MSTYGSVIRCPGCGAGHVLRVGEITNQRRIEFTCTICATDVILDNEIRDPAVYKKGRWDK
jgi:transposase-like protein